MTIMDGGWQSVTTKSRLNALALSSASPGRVFQKAHTWYVRQFVGAINGESKFQTLLLRRIRVRLSNRPPAPSGVFFCYAVYSSNKAHDLHRIRPLRRRLCRHRFMSTAPLEAYGLLSVFGKIATIAVSSTKAKN